MNTRNMFVGPQSPDDIHVIKCVGGWGRDYECICVPHSCELAPTEFLFL